jgi:RHS repeat-associated protein
VSQTHVQTYNGAADRTINYNYAVSGNPLETASYDDQGWNITDTDLLGRTTAFTDTWGDWTGYQYDDRGNLTRLYGDMGEHDYTYDNYNRMTSELFGTTTYDNVTYDAYNRIDHVDYPAAGSLRSTMSYDTFGHNSSVTYRLGNGTTTVSDTAGYTQSGRVNADTIASGSTSVASSYTYDPAGRLTAATIGSNSYSYGYGTESSSCNSVAGNNTNAGKDSNRTTQTINGVTTTFCYNQADQLASSSAASYNTPTYDSRGNMTQLGSGSSPLQLGYDSSNRNVNLVQTNASGTGTGTYYNRDVTSRITYREQDTITTWNWALASQLFYGYTGTSANFIRDANWNITEQDLSLPGGISLSVKPQQTGNAQKQYSLADLRGDTLLTLNAAGANTSAGAGPQSSFLYDPFGNAASSAVLPANTVNGSYGYAGAAEKLTETSLALNPIQMGARVYIAGMGRFTSPDPIQGGTPSPYAYVTDPINSNDFSGMLGVIMSSPYQACIQSCGSAANYLQPATPSGSLQGSAPNIQGPGSSHGAPIPIPAASTRVGRPVTSLQQSKSTSQTAHILTDGSLKSQSYSGAASWDWIGAISTENSFQQWGELIGGVGGCIIGGIAGGIAGAIAAGLLGGIGGAELGCAVLAPGGATAGAIAGGVTGWIAGGEGHQGPDALNALPPDYQNPRWR